MRRTSRACAVCSSARAPSTSLPGLSAASPDALWGSSVPCCAMICPSGFSAGRAMSFAGVMSSLTCTYHSVGKSHYTPWLRWNNENNLFANRFFGPDMNVRRILYNFQHANK